VLDRELRQLLAVRHGQPLREDEERVGMVPDEGIEGCVDVRRRPDLMILERSADGRRGLLGAANSRCSPEWAGLARTATRDTCGAASF
jgi:hypothetical protein